MGVRHNLDYAPEYGVKWHKQEKFALKIIFVMQIYSAHSSHSTQIQSTRTPGLGHTALVLPWLMYVMILFVTLFVYLPGFADNS